MNNQSFHPLLDSKKQLKARAYEKEKREINLIFKIFSILTLFLFYYSGWSSELAGMSNNPRAAFLIYMFTFISIYSILALPLKFYSEYKIEHKWGFSNHSIKSWLKDELKGYFVSLALILIITGFLFWIWQMDADKWWIWAGLAMAVFSIILTALFPVLILPIFNKYIPIENPDLVRRLGNILSKYGLNASGFFKQNLSLQTKKENAFLAGLGKTRRVVLADNLLENMTLDEIESVIAHEVGHYFHSHLWKQVFLGTIQQFLLFYLLNIIILKLTPNFLESLTWNLTIFPLFILILAFLSTVLFTIPSLALSRYFEKQADIISLETTGKIPFQKSLAGLANRNLANAYPDDWVKLLYYSHPPIGERLALAEKYQQSKI